MASFEKLRVSLSREPSGPLLDHAGAPDLHLSRREFLEAAFEREQAFLHSRTGKRIDFIPLPIDGDFAAGIFRRSAPVPLKDKKLELYSADNFEGAVFIISLAKDQTAWMQQNAKLGSPRPIIESYFAHLSQKGILNDWQVYVKNFEDEQEYFSVIRSRRDEIAEISFKFIPPNALSADDEVYNFVKALQIEAHPDSQKHTYKADPGQMEPDTPRMNASARIAMAGGGDAEIRDAKRRLLYSKNKGKITKDVPDEELPTPLPAHAPFVKRVRNWLFGNES